mmetsp:Transcript_5805/g.14837  ORF Transcript_5805/g.14837 Transcript_5805/m.14837 type:complete len:163 (-) Transcript_5805:1399-1887(-)|eukprot:jgi/Tetstr1/423172/TSEL_013940.t1
MLNPATTTTSLGRPRPAAAVSHARRYPAPAHARPLRVSSSSSEEAGGTQPPDKSRHPNLVNRLLERAASRRERGETFCRHCKGEGVVVCTTCQGAGVIDPEKVEVNSMKRAGYEVKQAFDRLRGNPAGKGYNFKITNRCRNCRGQGVTECMYCHGTGRFASK